MGYGDLVPVTAQGRVITTLIAALGHWFLSVPVAIVSVELARAVRRSEGLPEGEGPEAPSPPPCEACEATGHARDARYCRRCRTPLRG